MIDDLVTKGSFRAIQNVYFRAEYRLTLRSDNADLRLTKKGIDLGLVLKKERKDLLKNIINFLVFNLKWINLRSHPQKLKNLVLI